VAAKIRISGLFFSLPVIAVLDGGCYMRRLTFALVVIGLLACAGPASAGVVFDNITGTTDNFNVNGWTIAC
jgi:Na+-transporting methylmalonyl-CoA/oxaloacetate decarboxylase beta subunit